MLNFIAEEKESNTAFGKWKKNCDSGPVFSAIFYFVS